MLFSDVPANPPAIAYISWNGQSAPFVFNFAFKIKGGATIAEVRSTGSQTVFPPSQHSGEAIVWLKAGTPAKAEGDVIVRAVAHLSAAALLVRNWPGQGCRQDAALALAGGLSRIGWP